jgi:curli biogenesis system outer membrane secretion channel CsgG
MTRLLPFSLILISLLSGCVSVNPDKNMDNKVDKSYPILEGMPVSKNHTPYSPALVCLAENTSTDLTFNKFYKHVIAVGDIKDLTGKYDFDTGGAKVTQGASDMAVTALFKTNAYTIVDRLHMEISNNERILTNQSLVSDYEKVNNNKVLRKLTAGEVIGSNYTIVGSITELNYNIASGGAEAGIAGLGSKSRTFVGDVGMDLFLVDTRTTRVVDAISIKKQLVGYETRHGVYRFFDNELFDVNLGNKKQEPMQLAIRSSIEYAVYEFTERLYGLLPTTCADLKRKADGI